MKIVLKPNNCFAEARCCLCGIRWDAEYYYIHTVDGDYYRPVCPNCVTPKQREKMEKADTKKELRLKGVL